MDFNRMILTLGFLLFFTGCSSGEYIPDPVTAAGMVRESMKLRNEYIGQVDYYEKVHELTQDVLRGYNTDSQANLLMAWSLVQKGYEVSTGEFDPESLQQAREIITKVIERKPELWQAHSDLAWVELYAKRGAEAEAAIRTYKQLVEGSTNKYHKHNMAAMNILFGLYGHDSNPVLSEFEACMENAVNDFQKWHCMEVRARFHKLLHQQEEQIKMREQMANLFPKQAEGWELLGVAYIDANKPEEAMSTIEKALKIRRYKRVLVNYNLAMFHLAQWYVASKRKYLVRVVLSDMMKLGFHDSSDVQRAFELAKTFLRNQSLQEDVYDKAENDLPDDGRVLMQIAYFHLLEENYSKALSYYETAVSSRAEKSLKRHEKIEALLQAASMYLFKLDPDDPDYKSALKHVEVAMELVKPDEPNYGLAYWHYAYSLQLRGEDKDQLADLERARELYREAIKYNTVDTMIVKRSMEKLKTKIIELGGTDDSEQIKQTEFNGRGNDAS